MKEKVITIELEDLSNYDPEKCRDGGCYSFITKFMRWGFEEKWMVRYGTSADMEFCPICGSFGKHWDDEIEEYSCGGDEKITTEDVLLRTMNAIKDGCEVSFNTTTIEEEPEEELIPVKKILYKQIAMLADESQHGGTDTKVRLTSSMIELSKEIRNLEGGEQK